MKAMARFSLLIYLACSSLAAQTSTPATKELESTPKATPAEPTSANRQDKSEDTPPAVADKTTEKKPAALELPDDRELAVRLQIFLDQKHFGPGFIDGKPGTFTKLAIENYNTSLGRNKNDPQVIEEALKGVTQAYATAIVPSVVEEHVDYTLPHDRSLQAERKSMPYRSVAEFMAERYHTSEDLLIAINGPQVIRNAKARSAIKVPNIQPFRIEDLKHGRTHKKDEILSARHVVVDTGIKQVYVYELILPTISENEGNTVKSHKAIPQLIASFPITPGQTRFIPTGYWNLKNSVELPVWRYDKKLLETGVRSKESLTIPAGPNNPVGIIWNGLTKSGIGIHGTDNPRTIGRARSAGCIRLSNWDAARFPKLVRPGAIIHIK